MDKNTFALSFYAVMTLASLGRVAVSRKPGPGENVSRMRLCIAYGLLNLAIMTGAVAVTVLTIWTNAPGMGPWLLLALAALYGSAFGRLALGRSHDAGRGRGFAAMTFIPIAGFYPMFAAPAPDPARPPYKPKGRALRFLIGFVVLVVGSSLPVVLTIPLRESLPHAGEPTALLTEANVAAINAKLPKRIDSGTVLERVDYNPETSELIYRLTLDLPEIGLTDVAAGLKASATGMSCESKEMYALLEGGLSLTYVITTVSGEVVPGFSIRRSDCR